MVLQQLLLGSNTMHMHTIHGCLDLVHFESEWVNISAYRAMDGIGIDGVVHAQ